jgi:hypothetical protein
MLLAIPSITQYTKADYVPLVAMKTSGGKPTQSEKKKRDMVVRQVTYIEHCYIPSLFRPLQHLDSEPDGTLQISAGTSLSPFCDSS